MFGESGGRERRGELLETLVVFGLSEELGELAVDPGGETVGTADRFVGAAVATQHGGKRLEGTEFGENGVRVSEKREESEEFDGVVERAALHSREHARQIGFQSTSKRRSGRTGERVLGESPSRG